MPSCLRLYERTTHQPRTSKAMPPIDAQTPIIALRRLLLDSEVTVELLLGEEPPEPPGFGSGVYKSGNPGTVAFANCPGMPSDEVKYCEPELCRRPVRGSTCSEGIYAR